MAERVTPAFYAKIQAEPSLDSLVGRPTVYRRLQDSSTQFLRGMGQPPLGHAYQDRIDRIAREHVRVGLAPDGYLGAYRHIWVAVWDVVMESGFSPSEQRAMVDAASKRSINWRSKRY